MAGTDEAKGMKVYEIKAHVLGNRYHLCEWVAESPEAAIKQFMALNGGQRFHLEAIESENGKPGEVK